MTSLPDKDYLSSGTSRTEGSVKTNYFDKILDVLAELPGGAESVPEYTISSGAIVPAVGVFTVDTEGDAASDDLTNITTTNMPEGRIVFFRAANSARTVVVKHESGGTGQISTADGNDITLNNAAKWVVVVRNGADWEVVSGPSPSYLTSSTYTGNQTIAVTAGSFTRDLATVNVLSGASSDATFTIASLSASDDGKYFRFLNDDEHQLTIKPNDSTVAIWNSGDGYGIDLPYKGTVVTLQYDHSRTKFDIIEKTGGRVFIEGLVLYEPMHTITMREAGAASTAKICDITRQHVGTVNNDLEVLDESSAQLPPGCFSFPGNDEYIAYVDSSDWSIFDDQTGHKTIAFWAYQGTSTNHPLIYHYEDNDNFFALNISSGGDVLTTQLRLSGSYEILQDSPDFTIGYQDWHHICLIINGSDVGVYVDGQQEAYDGTWNTGAISGVWSIGGRAAGSSFFNGRIQDMVVCYNNPFNASPNVGLTDTIAVPNTPFVGVMH